ncbi:MAG: class F sortase, partial [bacterium]|nr:class F sortase [bacterium]
PAVFDNLSKLRSGDKLYIKDQNGATYTFVVRESRDYDPKANTTGIFISNDGKAHLNLITCEGTWNKSQKSYSNRLIVFTDKQ